jgi:predicted dehydrogenase
VIAPARVGLVGCGAISNAYVTNAAAFDRFDIVACSDRDGARSLSLAAQHGLEAMELDALLADDEIDLVLNLTPPAAHDSVTRAALEHGKHVYSEKPLAMTAIDARSLVSLADARGLTLACAPDVFLGGALQAARRLIDDGAIGRPLAVSATMLGGGQEAWHPDPDIFFRDGAGPLLDMGPYYIGALVALLGPVRRVAGFATTFVDERTIEIGPRSGEHFVAQTPTHTTGLLELDSGISATLVATFEAPHHYSSTFLVLGSEGTLALPDPNMFAEPIRMRDGHGRDDWAAVSYHTRGRQEVRGIGLDEQVDAIENGREPRASGRLALHVVDVARSILQAAETGDVVSISSSAARPQPMPVDPPVALRRAE